MTNVLVIESNRSLSDRERDFLDGAGFTLFIADSDETALKLIDEVAIHAIILNCEIPGEDSFALCRKLRDRVNVPILFATTDSSEEDIVRGLGLGADDYLVPPFTGTVLIAHVRAHLASYARLLQKDSPKGRAEVGMVIDSLVIRPKARQALIDGRQIPLTGKEFDLLFFLASHPNEVFSKDQLFESVWGLDPIGESATVTVHINRLRDKLKSTAGRPYDAIATVWGAGYRFQTDPELIARSRKKRR